MTTTTRTVVWTVLWTLVFVAAVAMGVRVALVPDRESAELIPKQTVKLTPEPVKATNDPLPVTSEMPAWYRERLLAAKARHPQSTWPGGIPLWELVPGPCTCGKETNMMILHDMKKVAP